MRGATVKEKKKELIVNFEVIIKQDENKFVGECKELPGLVVSGSTRSGVIKNVKAAIPLYLLMQMYASLLKIV